ncbi:MAG: hypothetical protein U1F87_09360 [Kiritimatiellia bacterium]
MEGLLRVLRKAPDLVVLVGVLNRQAADSGMENPVVRKALGKVFLEYRLFPQAIEQLRIAAEAEPNDAEIYPALVSAYDQQNDPEGALRELFAGAEAARRDIAMYKDIAARCEKLNRPAEAERARTMIVEILPNESESHTLLAGIRQEQNRWGDAITHWTQVARIRSLEPTGLQRLAEARIHEKQWPEAARPSGCSGKTMAHPVRRHPPAGRSSASGGGAGRRTDRSKHLVVFQAQGLEDAGAVLLDGVVGDVHHRPALFAVEGFGPHHLADDGVHVGIGDLGGAERRASFCEEAMRRDRTSCSRRGAQVKATIFFSLINFNCFGTPICGAMETLATFQPCAPRKVEVGLLLTRLRPTTMMSARLRCRAPASRRASR